MDINEKISNREMEIVADNIELYMNLYISKYIIPPDLRPRQDEFDKGLDTIKKLIKKLRKHNSSVFKYADENSDVYK